MSCEICRENNAKYDEKYWTIISKGFDKQIAVCYRCPNCGEGYCGYRKKVIEG